VVKGGGNDIAYLTDSRFEFPVPGTGFVAQQEHFVL
jgi:hypothetical protein